MAQQSSAFTDARPRVTRYPPHHLVVFLHRGTSVSPRCLCPVHVLRPGTPICRPHGFSFVSGYPARRQAR
jgi:hypothetical protein